MCVLYLLIYSGLLCLILHVLYDLEHSSVPKKEKAKTEEMCPQILSEPSGYLFLHLIFYKETIYLTDFACICYFAFSHCF